MELAEFDHKSSHGERGGLTIKGIPAKPSEDSLRLGIYPRHQGDLRPALVQVILIDANAIRPYGQHLIR